MREIAIGVQDFNNLIENDYFYIDKTAFINEWWNSGDAVTLITRPRRFGKTLNMSMLECFSQINTKIAVTCLSNFMYGKRKSFAGFREHIQ